MCAVCPGVQKPGPTAHRQCWSSQLGDHELQKLHIQASKDRQCPRTRTSMLIIEWLLAVVQAVLHIPYAKVRCTGLNTHAWPCLL